MFSIGIGILSRDILVKFVYVSIANNRATKRLIARRYVLFIWLDAYDRPTYHLHDIYYTGKMYARDVTTGDQHPMRLTSIQIDTSMFKKYII